MPTALPLTNAVIKPNGANGPDAVAVAVLLIPLVNTPLKFIPEAKTGLVNNCTGSKNTGYNA